jgi:hypothetical protein
MSYLLKIYGLKCNYVTLVSIACVSKHMQVTIATAARHNDLSISE